MFITILVLLYYVVLTAGDEKWNELVSEAEKSSDDPAAQFLLGQYYRYSCPCRSLAVAMNRPLSAEECKTECMAQAYHLYRRTRALVHHFSQLRPISLYFDYTGMLNDLGLMLADHNRVDEAVDAYREAIDLSPTNTAALANLASLENVRGNITGAKALYELALASNPTSISVLHNYGIFCHRWGWKDEARVMWTRSIQLEPEMYLSRCNLATMECAAGHMDEAQELYRQVHTLSIHPTISPTNTHSLSVHLDSSLPINTPADRHCFHIP